MKFIAPQGKAAFESAFSKVMKNYFVLGWLDKPNKPTKKGSLSFVLFESPFTSVSIVSRGHPSLVSLQTPLNNQRTKICRRCQ
jgi:hypothetical protein